MLYPTSTQYDTYNYIEIKLYDFLKILACQCISVEMSSIRVNIHV